MSQYLGKPLLFRARHDKNRYRISHPDFSKTSQKLSSCKGRSSHTLMPFFCQKDLHISANDKNQARSRTEIRLALIWGMSSSTSSSSCSSLGAFFSTRMLRSSIAPLFLCVWGGYALSVPSRLGGCWISRCNPNTFGHRSHALWPAVFKDSGSSCMVKMPV